MKNKKTRKKFKKKEERIDFVFRWLSMVMSIYCLFTLRFDYAFCFFLAALIQHMLIEYEEVDEKKKI